MPNANLIQTISMPEQTKTMLNHSSPCAEWKDGRLMYDFARCLQFQESTGKDQFGKEFRIFREDHRLIYRLLLYMIGDEEGAKRVGLSLDKGILLTGPIGCGKTSLMILLSQFMPPVRQYLVKPCRDISFEFLKGGFDVIFHYASSAYAVGYQPRKTYCFDDLGLENSGKYYGNDCNVMAEILLSRYDLFVSTGLLTHATTNLNSSEIERIYGNRIRSRMREMFNLVAFPKEVGDKRA